MSAEDVWLTAIDLRSGRQYYYSKKTGERAWVPPDSFVRGTSTDSSQTDWNEVLDSKTGRLYYFNRVTKITQWTQPEKFVAAARPQPQQPQPQPQPQAQPEPQPQPAASPTATTEAASEETKSTHTEQSAPENKTEEEEDKDSAGEEGSDEDSEHAEHEEESANPPSKKREVSAASKSSILPPPPSGDDEHEEWKEAKDENGKIYFYNIKTKQTSWTDPRVIAKGNMLDRLKVSKPKASDFIHKRIVSEPPALEHGAEFLALKHAVSTRDLQHAKLELEEEQEQKKLEEEFDGMFAKHRHGWVARTFRTGPVITEEQLMSFKKSLIKKSLLKKNRTLDTEAVQAFKNIMSYMGDRKSSKSGLEHPKKILKNALESPPGLRDEVYLALVKQTTNNPRDSSVIKGWELFAFVLATFPPSVPLRKYLVHYWQESAKTEEYSGATQDEIRHFAEYCLDSLPRIIDLGPRTVTPSKAELEGIKSLHGVSIRVHLIDDTFKAFNVDSYTQVKDVIEQMGSRLNLAQTRVFSLYERTPDGDRLLDPKMRILDVLAGWESHKSKDVEHFKILFKARVMLKPGHVLVRNDTEALHMMYLQCVFDVIHERYMIKDHQAEALAALQLQATFGDYHPDLHGKGWLQDKLEQYVPSSFVDPKRVKRAKVVRAEWEQKVFDKYAKLKGYSADIVRLNYLDYCQEWPGYGVTFFRAKQSVFNDLPEMLLLGVTCDGLQLVNNESRAILEKFSFSEIVNWGSSEEKFVVVIGNVVKERKLTFETLSGQEIQTLLNDYVQCKIEGADNKPLSEITE